MEVSDVAVIPLLLKYLRMRFKRTKCRQGSVLRVINVLCVSVTNQVVVSHDDCFGYGNMLGIGVIC